MREVKYPKEIFLAISSKRTYNVIEPLPSHLPKRKKKTITKVKKTVIDFRLITVHITTRRVQHLEHDLLTR